MNRRFAAAFLSYLAAALVICLLGASILFCVGDGVRRMAGGAFHLGLGQILGGVAVAASVSWAWHRTSDLIDDTTPADEG